MNPLLVFLFLYFFSQALIAKDVLFIDINNALAEISVVQKHLNPMASGDRLEKEILARYYSIRTQGRYLGIRVNEQYYQHPINLNPNDIR